MPCFVVVLFSVFMPTCFLCLYAYLFFLSLCLLVFVFCFLSLSLLVFLSVEVVAAKGLSDHPARWTSCKQEQVAGAQARKVERCVKSKLQNCNRGPLLTNTDQLQLRAEQTQAAHFSRHVSIQCFFLHCNNCFFFSERMHFGAKRELDGLKWAVRAARELQCLGGASSAAGL